jgi:cytochrome c oxidase subunit 2
MYKWIMSGLVTIACALGVYLLASGLPDKPHEEVAPEGQELLKITASNFEFNEKEYHVKAGTTYKISFSNELGNHGAQIKDLDIDLTKDAPSVSYTFDKPGTYEIHCSVMCGTGHADMKSTIVVA